jgi:integrase
MPRKPKHEKLLITVVVDAVPYAVHLHPPRGSHKSWYAFWSGLVTSRSTGHATREGAVAAAETMLKEWLAGGEGDRPRPADLVLTDEEFEKIQRAHYGRKKDPRAKRRAEKSLVSCLEAVRAFKEISGLDAISTATPDDCAAFQRAALEKPRNWRSMYPRSKKEQGTVSLSTVVKWSVALAAAFERVNRNGKKKCVRGVVDERKLLDANPWRQFTWVERTKRPLRQFDAAELTGLLDHLAERWAGVTVGAAVAKVFLWSGCRREEVVSLTWDQYRPVNGEHHFDVEGKWGVRRWFRVPDGLYRDLAALRVEGSPHVFAAYNAQLRAFYESGERPAFAKVVGETFDPPRLGDWFYERVKGWAKGLPNGDAYIHVFRKTTLQYARAGEDANRRVAEDARVSEAVLLGHYVTEQDEQLRAKSNRTFERVAAALPPEVAVRYGHAVAPADPLEERFRAAADAQDWETAAVLAAELGRRQRASAV